jgi:hypothetical protein
MRAQYDIRSCCGDIVNSVVVDAYGDIDLDDDYPRCNEVLADAGYAGRGKCDGCGDTKYHATFSHYVGGIVNGLYFNFTRGKVSGDISGATRYDLIAALETVVANLRAEDDELSYIGYDEGKVSTG